MSLQDLALPIDIPWRLIATSNDMLANAANPFPFAMWRSSLAIFAYNPNLSNLPEEFSDRELTFLKLVASITSYTPSPPDTSKWDSAAIAAIDPVTGRSFPCSGALVQVAIYPKAQPSAGTPTDVTKLAYFTAMEPQKRELIEVGTESGETLTQSATDVNVRKGVTNTDSLESLNVFTGMQGSVQGGAGGASAGASLGVGGQWGTIHRSSTETVNNVTTDTSRQKRETSSHSTNLSQLYHLLNSYHLGTNRALFFLQSRPHTMQQKDRFTFINGPQEIEGLQEFFLVVSRPKGVSLEQYCVDGLLYTGHFDADVLQRTINEPKTAETQWIDLWATARVGGQSTDSHRSVGTVPPMPVLGVNDTINYANLVGQTETTFDITQSDFDGRIRTNPGDNAALIVNKNKNAEDSGGTRSSNFPAILDQTITTAVLRSTVHTGYVNFLGWPVPFVSPDPEPGWRVDRTRGQGGYDLWEDPLNNSANSDADPRRPEQTQAFVDVLSVGSPLDPPTYFPDCGVRVRAIVWPGGSDATASYHARIKAYFIRNDLPAERSVPMFVVARGVSTCPESPVSRFIGPSTGPTALLSDIVWEDLLAPAHVAPWTTPATDQLTPTSTPSASSATSSGASASPSAPPPARAGSAVPSGIDANAIGAARMKMANSVGPELRRSLRRMLKTPQASPVAFVHTDLFFKTAAVQLVVAEVARLTSSAGQNADLARYTVAHPAARFIPSAGGLALTAISGKVAQARAKPPRPSKDFPALTLSAASTSDIAALHKAGIQSALDLLPLGALELSRTLGVTEAEARAMRLRAIGLTLE